MLKLFLFAALFASLCSYGQSTSQNDTFFNVSQDSATYIKKSIAFIKQVMPQALSDTSFILVDKPFSFEYFDCIQEVLADTTLFTRDELLIIRDKQHPSLSRWPKEFFDKIKLISSDTINAIFNDPSRWWLYYYTQFGNRGFNSYSVPIFLKNGTYCLFYSDYSCGDLCGGGQLTLYKKEEDKWIAIKSYCNWVS